MCLDGIPTASAALPAPARLAAVALWGLLGAGAGWVGAASAQTRADGAVGGSTATGEDASATGEDAAATGKDAASVGEDAIPGDGDAAATGKEATPTGRGASVTEDDASAAGPGGNPDSPPSGGARVSGSLTLRSSMQEGAGNDRFSSRLSLEWGAGDWSGGFTAEFENTRVEGALLHEPGWGSFELPERWVGWSGGGANVGVELRLGTAFGLRFAEGLVLGSASFDGLSLTLDVGDRCQVTTLAGRTESLDPLEFFDEQLTLFPEDEELGTDGELLGVRAQLEAGQGLVLGWNALQARAESTPWARLGSMDVAWHRGFVDLSAELATRDEGGSALYLRTDFNPSDRWGLGFEHRRYSGFVSPVGNAPLYGGLSAGSETDEEGWLLRFDLHPGGRWSASYTWDYSEDPTKGDGSEPRVRRDHRLELSFTLAPSTALAYGFEFEDLAGGYDGAVHTVLVTHAFADGGRLSGRLSVDRATPGHRTTLRTNYRRPLLGRRITLLVDETLRFDADAALSTLQLGSSFRLGGSSHLTVRGTVGDGEPDSMDVTWYRRF